MIDARAFWVASPGRGEIRTESLHEPGPGEVQVKAVHSGVSRGTEALVFAGRVPETEYSRMRAPFQAGDFPAPVKYGYASVGRVERGPDDLIGRHVFVLYPHQTRYVVPISAIHVLPEGLPPGRAVLAANMETAVNGMWDAAARVGDRIAVIGAGTVGCLVAWLAARIVGCAVELIDVNPQRASMASTVGARFALPADAARDADLVVHASGSPSGLRTALDVAGDEATVVEMSWYGTSEVALPLGGAFHSRRLTVRSSQVGRISAEQRPRWTTRRRMTLALDLLRRGSELDALITGESGFEELPAVMAALCGGGMDALCHRIRYTT